MDLIWRSMGTSVGLARPCYAQSVCPLRCFVQYFVLIRHTRQIVAINRARQLHVEPRDGYRMDLNLPNRESCSDALPSDFGSRLGADCDLCAVV